VLRCRSGLLILLLCLASSTAIAQSPSPGSGGKTPPRELVDHLIVRNGFNANGYVNVLSFGAKCDGNSDDWLPFTNAATAVSLTNGGTILLPPGRICALGATVAITTSNVRFACQRSGYAHHDVTVPFTGCDVQWIGEANGTMFSAIAPSGSTAKCRIDGFKMDGILLDGAGLAGSGIVLKSASEGRITHNLFRDFKLYSLDLNVVQATSSNFGEACDS